MIDEFLKTDYERVPLNPGEYPLFALIKWAVNSARCYAHYGGKHSEQECKNKEMMIAFVEMGGEPKVLKMFEELQFNLETLEDVLDSKITSETAAQNRAAD